MREVTVHGEVLVDGRTMPDSPYESQTFDEASGTWENIPSGRGRLAFVCIRDCVGWSTQHLSGAGTADYELSLAPGVYQVNFYPGREPFSGDPLAQEIVTQPVYVLDPQLVVDGDMRRDFDIRRVNLSMTVTEDGEILSELGDWSQSRLVSNTRGRVELAYRPYLPYTNDPVPPYSVDIGNWGPAVAQFGATPGRYELTTELAAIGRISQALSLGDDLHMEVDVSLTHRDEQLTWNGEPWQANAPTSGELVFKPALASVPLGEPSSDGTFTMSEWARPVDLVWQRTNEQSGRVDGEFVIFRGCNPAQSLSEE